ncbi:hypothetical protein PV371_17530 [Streptomyces sp. TX20-6-3]|uniref:hypothetical protein n=1 Tax=Streptomyces sp. TX20-6-3 TaxID=3028705 RepID=UPI0029AB7C3A|nr:hypothetical protein [Streptomyces sp. TX20-6-3]MDX2561449.1 hypothetical protein [Streptomyces sp. TX20-6-3]
MRAQEAARAAGGRPGFAVVEAPSGGQPHRPGGEPQRSAGGAVLKELAPGGASPPLDGRLPVRGGS